MRQATHDEKVKSPPVANLFWWRIDRISTEHVFHFVDFAGIGFSRNAHVQYQTYHYNAFGKPYKQTALLSFPEKCTG